MTEPTTHELHEAVRQRDQLLDEASRLLAAGAGDTSPEYQEFVRLRKELSEINRTRDLDHCVLMVRKKARDLRTWLRRTDRALGSIDPVDAIITLIQERIQKYQHAPFHEAKCLTDLLTDIENGEWVEQSEGVESVKCSCCEAEFDDEETLFQHCAYSKGCAR